MLLCPAGLPALHSTQELQEKRMAAIGDPAHKRGTLGDKVCDSVCGGGGVA